MQSKMCSVFVGFLILVIIYNFHIRFINKMIDHRLKSNGYSRGTLLTQTKPSLIRVGNSPVHGNGVFAMKRFDIGEIVETAPLLHVPYGSLHNYVFHSKIHKCNYLALGYGSIYNHSETSNAVQNMLLDSKKKGMFRIIATKPIENGTEITINYGPNYNWKR